MSRRVFSNKGKKGEVKGAFCTHCKNTGETEMFCVSHNVLDVKGRVCCPKILANVCSKCDSRGHLPSKCPGAKGEPTYDVFKVMRRDRERRAVHEESRKQENRAVDKTGKKTAFACLEISDSDSDSDSENAPPANVTIRSPRSQTKSGRRASQMDWTPESDDEE